MKRFGFFLQLCLLTFGLTAHALALDPSAASPDTLYQRLSEVAAMQTDFLANRPDTVNPADFPASKPQVSEAGPFEKEEEEEVRSAGESFKILTPAGSDTSAFFCARPEPAMLVSRGCLPRAYLPPAPGTPARKHLLFEVFLI